MLAGWILPIHLHLYLDSLQSCKQPYFTTKWFGKGCIVQLVITLMFYCFILWEGNIIAGKFREKFYKQFIFMLVNLPTNLIFLELSSIYGLSSYFMDLRSSSYLYRAFPHMWQLYPLKQQVGWNNDGGPVAKILQQKIATSPLFFGGCLQILIKII